MNVYHISLADMYNTLYKDGQYIQANDIAQYLIQHGASFYFDGVGRMIIGHKPEAAITNTKSTMFWRVKKSIKIAIAAILGSIF